MLVNDGRSRSAEIAASSVQQIHTKPNSAPNAKNEQTTPTHQPVTMHRRFTPTRARVQIFNDNNYHRVAKASPDARQRFPFPGPNTQLKQSTRPESCTPRFPSNPSDKFASRRTRETLNNDQCFAPSGRTHRCGAIGGRWLACTARAHAAPHARGVHHCTNS